jgi:hypothetical protein
MRIQIVKKAEKKPAPNSQCTFIIEGLPEPRK